MSSADLERARSALSYLSPDMPRDDWVKVGMAIKAELGEEGFEMFDEWSRQSDKYVTRDTRDTWKSCSANGGIGGGTLFYLAQKSGWHDNGTCQKPSEELAERRRIAAERTSKEDAERDRRRASARQKVVWILECARPASADHPYLLRKKVAPVPALLEISASRTFEVIGYAPSSGDEPLVGRLLVAPVSIDRALSSVEFIDEAGRKSALVGGAKSGGYWAAQELPDGDGARVALLIGEGVATVLSAREATGHPVIAALTDTNLPKVAKAMRKRYPKAVMVILADLVKATGETNPHAIEAARTVGGLLAVPDFGSDRDPAWTDFNDLLARQGPELVAECLRRQIQPGAGEGALEDASSSGHHGEGGDHPTGDAEDVDTVRRLAELSPIEYDRVRQVEADALGVRVATLDGEVQKMKPASTDGVDGQGAVPLFVEVKPWLDPVNGAELLEDLATVFLRYVFMPVHTSTILALWVVHTFCYDLRRCTPILGLTSPQRRCGKTTLMSLLLSVVNRPLAASNISPSCVFRAIDLWHPTLLIDEADSFLRDNEELRGILNSGHTRDLAYVLRTAGEEHEPRRFSTWAPKALALIGKLPPTLHDRAIVVELARKTPGDRVERLTDFDGTDLRRRCLRWVEDHASEIKTSDPGIPGGAHDRAADNWAPLLAIADAAGGDWPARALQALAAQPDEPDDSAAVMLLADIRQFFKKGVDKVFTADLLAYLIAIEARPWNEWRRGKPLTARQLAGLLQPFKIRPGTKREGADTFKGYYMKSFEDAFLRYLPADSSVTPSQFRQDAGRRDSSSVTPKSSVTDSYPLQPAPQLACDGVTDPTTPPKGERGDHGGEGGRRIEVEV